MVAWQDLAALMVVAAAAAYLLWRFSLRFRSPQAAGCGGCHGCPVRRGSEASNSSAAPEQLLTLQLERPSSNGQNSSPIGG